MFVTCLTCLLQSKTITDLLSGVRLICDLEIGYKLADAFGQFSGSEANRVHVISSLLQTLGWCFHYAHQ